MTNKFKVILTVILIFGVVSLLATHRWYKKLDNFSSLENYGTYLKKEFPGVEHISTNSLATLIKSHRAGIESLLLIDCRNPEEFQVSHLESAINLQTPEAVSAYLNENPADHIVTYCAVGYRSAKLAEELNQRGFANVKNVIGSIFSWANEDRPLVDPNGNPAEKVHPYNQFWRRHLNQGKAIELPEQ